MNETKARAIKRLRSAMQRGNLAEAFVALDTLVHLGNVAALAREVGINRVTLYRMCKPGASPSFEHVVKVLAAVGLRLKPTLN